MWASFNPSPQHLRTQPTNTNRSNQLHTSGLMSFTPVIQTQPKATATTANTPPETMTALVNQYDLFTLRARNARTSKLYCKWAAKAKEVLHQIKAINPTFDPSL